MVPIVPLCLPYRSPCTLLTWSSERIADTPEAQREQGRAILYRWKPWWTDFGHLYEEEERMYFLTWKEQTLANQECFTARQRIPSPRTGHREDK